jgi:hypothetical protein
MASDPFDGSGSLAAPWSKNRGSGTITQSGGEAGPSAATDDIGYVYVGAATGNNQRSKIVIVDALGLSGGAQTYWTVECLRSGSNKYAFSVTGNHWWLTKNSTDVDDDVGSFNNGGSVPMEVELTVEVSGANRVLKGYVGGVLIVSYTDTASVLSGGDVGMGVYQDAAASVAKIASWEGGNYGSTAVDLDGDATAAGAAAGALSHGVPLAGGATGQATATGAVTHGVPLQGAADAAADATADVSVSGASLIAFRSLSSVPQSGVSSVLFRQPDTLENTDLALWCVVNKYPTNGPGTPTGYSLTAQAVMGDGGAAGADQGDVYATVFHRVCDGTEDAATEAISVTGGNAVYSRSIAFSRSGGTGWVIATAAGSQGVAAANWNITTGSLDLAAGDTVLVFVAKNSDLDVVGHSAHTLSATGVTFGTFNSRAGPTGTTSGDDVAYQLGEVQVTAGGGSGPVTFTMSATGSAGNSSGGVMLVRLRAATAVDLAGAAVVTGTATGGLSHGVPLQGAAAGVAAASGGLTHGVPLAGTAAGQATAAAGMTHGVPLQGAAAGQATAAAQIVVQVSEAEMFGRRPRPGRGPYSVGRYFRPRVEAYTARGQADLAAAGAGQATAAAAISLGVTLLGAGIAQAIGSGAVTHAVPLGGSSIAAAAANGNLSIAVTLQGASLAQAAAGGTLALRIELAAGAVAQAVATAAMAHGVPLFGAALAAVTAAGALASDGLAGNAAAQGVATGQLWLSVPLSAAAVAQAQASGVLGLTVTLSAAALAQSGAAAALQGSVQLLSDAQAQALASGTLTEVGVVNLAGQAQALGSASATLFGSLPGAGHRSPIVCTAVVRPPIEVMS